jgi:hypothetical protein
MQRLVSRGELALVVRESGPGVTRPNGDLLDRRELAELLRCLAKVQRLVRRAAGTKTALTVLREDVATPLSPWTAWTQPVLADVENVQPSTGLVDAIRRRHSAVSYDRSIGTNERVDAVYRTAFELAAKDSSSRRNLAYRDPEQRRAQTAASRLASSACSEGERRRAPQAISIASDA